VGQGLKGEQEIVIREAIELLVNELNQYVRVAGEQTPVAQGNIALLEAAQGGGNGGPDLGRIILSLVNLEEESALKNGTELRTDGGVATYAHRPVFLNLYLLFSANFADYGTSLAGLSQVIEFFQSKKIFSYQSSPPAAGMPQDERVRNLRLSLDLHTLSFEEINDLWGSLGGKQVPFVLYRARVAEIRAVANDPDAPPITRIDQRFG
jgi:hypothetical protein